MLVFVVLLLSVGVFGDIFGLKKVFNVGLIVFLLVFVLCGLLISLGVLFVLCVF